MEIRMPAINVQCFKCKSKCESEPIYRREAVAGTKKSRWIRLAGFSYCKKCYAITVYPEEYYYTAKETDKKGVIQYFGVVLNRKPETKVP